VTTRSSRVCCCSPPSPTCSPTSSWTSSTASSTRGSGMSERVSRPNPPTPFPEREGGVSGQTGPAGFPLSLQGRGQGEGSALYHLRRFLSAFRRQRLGMIGVSLLALVVICAVFAPWIAPFDPNKIDPIHLLESPSGEHWMGTDGLGRDVFSRLVYGARISLYSGSLVVSVSMLLGTTIGLVAGYAGGLVDGFLMRCMDALLAFPGLILALAITAALGPSLTNAMLA